MRHKAINNLYPKVQSQTDNKSFDVNGNFVEVDENKVLFYNKKFLEEGEFLPYGDTFK